MGETTGISWCDHTFNPWRGCQKVSPGCKYCYAETQAARNPKVLGEWGPDGVRAMASESYWKQPLKWDRKAFEAGVRRKVFCGSLMDVFEDRPELVEPRRRLAKLISDTPNLDWLLLTKRIENAKDMLYEMWFEDCQWPTNYWIGTSCENQEMADQRIPHLLRIPAPVHFVSAEQYYNECTQ